MRNPQDPIRVELPDGDANIATTEYIAALINPFLNSIASIISSENTTITSINTRVQEWIDEQQENGG